MPSISKLRQSKKKKTNTILRELLFKNIENPYYNISKYYFNIKIKEANNNYFNLK
jgi:hypothetical protein